MAIIRINDIPTAQRVGKDVAQIFFSGATDTPLHSLDDYSIVQVRGSAVLQQMFFANQDILSSGSLCGSSETNDFQLTDVEITTAPYHFNIGLCQTDLDTTIYKYLPEPGGSIESVTLVMQGLIDAVVRMVRQDILGRLWAHPTVGWATTLDVNDVPTVVNITPSQVWQMGEAAEFLRNLYTNQSDALLEYMDEDKVLHVSPKLFSALRADVAAGCCNDLTWLASQDPQYRPTFLGIKIIRNRFLLPSNYDALLTHKDNLVIGLDRTNPNNMLRVAYNEHLNKLQIKGQIYIGKAVLDTGIIQTSLALRS